jgi:hypothetical protein
MINIAKIGVEMSLTGNALGMVNILSRRFLGLNKNISATQMSLTKVKAALGGLAAVGIGVGIGKGLYDLAKSAGDVVDAQTKMLQIGISHRNVAQETAIAYKNIGIAGATVAGNISNLATLRAVLGGKNAQDFSAANAALPAYTQAQYALSSRGVDPGQLDQFVKALDIMGAFNTNGEIDPAKFGPALKMAVSAVLTTNGLLTGKAFYQAVRLSGPAASAMGEKGYLQNMVEVLLALGGRGARGLEYGATTFLGGQVSKNTAVMFDRLGLTSARDYSRSGSRWSLKSDTIVGSAMLAKGDIIGWIQKYFLPNAAKHHLSPLQAAATLPQTLQLLITTIANMTPQIARSVQQQAAAQSADPYAAALASATGSGNNFHDALHSLAETLGTPLLQASIPILNDLTNGIREFTQYLGSHEGMVKAIDYALVGLAATLTVLGTAAIVGALAAMIGGGGYIAIAIIGIGALGVAIAKLPNLITAFDHAVLGLVKDLLHPFGAGHPTPAPVVAPVPTQAQIKARYNGGSLLMAPSSQEYDTQHAAQTDATMLPRGAPGNPLHVVVQNAKDIGTAAVSRVTSALSSPSTGSTGNNLRLTPSGSAALQMPGTN